MLLWILAVLAVAVVAGFWFSYYQSVRRLRAHDRDTVAMMERDLIALEGSGASVAAIAAARERISTFRQKHGVR